MSDNQNLLEEIIPIVEGDGQDSSGSTTDDEVLPLEEQKKAINLQDLIYVRKYIDNRNGALKNEINANLDDYKQEVNDAQNNFETEQTTSYNQFKEDMNTEFEQFKDEVATSGVVAAMQTEIDNIKNGATRVGDATKVQNINLSENIKAQFGDYIVPKLKPIPIDNAVTAICLSVKKRDSGYRTIVNDMDLRGKNLLIVISDAPTIGNGIMGAYFINGRVKTSGDTIIKRQALTPINANEHTEYLDTGATTLRGQTHSVAEFLVANTGLYGMVECQSIGTVQEAFNDGEIIFEEYVVAVYEVIM